MPAKSRKAVIQRPVDATRANAAYSSRAICLGRLDSSSPTNPETDTPSCLTAFSSGNTILNRSSVTDSKLERLSIDAGNVRLRVINSKSANFTLRVTVRPHASLSSQCRQTLSTSGFSSDAISSNLVRSLENVFSAPTDFRIRFVCVNLAIVDAS
jgi:hypothetical protein